MISWKGGIYLSYLNWPRLLDYGIYRPHNGEYRKSAYLLRVHFERVQAWVPFKEGLVKNAV